MVYAIKGRTVQLHEMVQTGVDDFNHPIMEESIVDVENVLIEPASNDEVVSEIQMSGKHVVYNLHIPKGDTHHWKDAIVDFYGQSWQTLGDSLIYDEDLTPGPWNKKVKVESYE